MLKNKGGGRLLFENEQYLNMRRQLLFSRSQGAMLQWPKVRNEE